MLTPEKREARKQFPVSARTGMLSEGEAPYSLSNPEPAVGEQASGKTFRISKPRRSLSEERHAASSARHGVGGQAGAISSPHNNTRTKSRQDEPPQASSDDEDGGDHVPDHQHPYGRLVRGRRRPSAEGGGNGAAEDDHRGVAVGVVSLVGSIAVVAAAPTTR